MPPAFDRFVAIDWSGAKGPRYAGIAVAEAPAGSAAPRLVAPPGGRWNRTAVYDWLLDGLERGPALVGIDCAFSLPFAVASGYFPGAAATAFDLWDRVEAVTAGYPDFLGGPFADHPAFADGFWRAGPRPQAYRDPQRTTERVCRAEGAGSPQSPYKLIGAKQVGRGSLAGMRVLRALRRAAPGRIAVWPFDEPAAGATVCVEIYPRLFLKRTGFGLRKIRVAADVDAALLALGSAPAGLPLPPSDHEADALVSAAGLRRLAPDPAVWRPAGLDADARLREGWIFGCGAAATP